MNELLLQSGIPVSKNNSNINEMNYYDANSISENVLFEILLNGKILPSPDINILNILYGELDSFFEGNITAANDIIRM